MVVDWYIYDILIKDFRCYLVDELEKKIMVLNDLKLSDKIYWKLIFIDKKWYDVFMVKVKLVKDFEKLFKDLVY